MGRLRTVPVARCGLLRLRIVAAAVLAAGVLIAAVVMGCDSGGETVYRNDAYGFSLRYPSGLLKQVDDPTLLGFMRWKFSARKVFAFSSDDSKEMLFVGPQRISSPGFMVSGDATFHERAAARFVSMLKKAAPNAVIVSSEAAALGGLKGIRVRYHIGGDDWDYYHLYRADAVFDVSAAHARNGSPENTAQLAAALDSFDGQLSSVRGDGESKTETRHVPYDAQRLNCLGAQFAAAAMVAEPGHLGGAEEAPTYYVKNGGDDSASGLSDAEAWATVAKVNASTFSPGQSIGFKRGDVWRERIVIASSGSAARPITFRGYGSGPKPLFLGSRDLGRSNGWTLDSTGKWRWTSTVNPEICAMHYNDATLHGVRKASVASLTAQGDFYWNSSTQHLYVYSTSNPGTFYSNIEGAQYNNALDTGTSNYITVSGLDFRYWGSGGLIARNGTGVVFEYNDISWIGAGRAAQPWGNAIQTGGSVHFTARYNRIDQAYDAGMSTITLDGITMSGAAFYGNAVSRCEYGFELQTTSTAGVATGTLVCGNVFYDNGGGWLHGVRPDPTGKGLQSWTPYSSASNCIFSNNIIYASSYSHIRIPAANWIADRNRYYPDGSLFVVWGNGPTKFAAWQATGRDTNGSIMDEVLGDFGEVPAAPKWSGRQVD